MSALRQKNKVIISGASGFVGSHLKVLFEEMGSEVVEISRQSAAPNKMSWHYFLSNPVQADVWIHLAGKAHDINGTADGAAYDTANFVLTRQFYDAFCNSDAKIFIFMSSVKAAADQVEGILKESDEPDPKTPYGISKLKAEQYLLEHLPEGKKVYLLRPCMIHGPGNKGNLNLLFNLVQKGIPWPLASFQNKRSFLSIDNLCAVIEKLFQGQAPSGIYQLADDDPLSTNDLIALIGESIGRKVKLWHISPSLIRIFANFGDIFGLPLNSSRLQKLTESYVVDNQKIKSTLQIELPVNARTGLIQTIKSFQNI